MADETRKVRFGILCSGPVQPAWTARLLEQLDQVAEAELALVVVVDGGADPHEDPRVTPESTRRAHAWPVLRALLTRKQSPATRPLDLTRALRGVPRVDAAGADGMDPLDTRTASAVRRIAEEKLDFLIDLLGAPIPPSMLAAPAHGVWGFRPGDPTLGRTEPAGFWEIARGDAVTRGALVRYAADPEEEEILHAGAFRTRDDSWRQNRDRLFLGWAHWPARVCREIVVGVRTRPAAPAGHRAPTAGEGPSVAVNRPDWSGRRTASTLPDAAEAARFLAVVGRNYVRNVWSDLFRHEMWSMGVVDAPLESVMAGVSSDEVRWLRHPDGACYLADPFGVARNGDATVLAEEFDYRRPVGRLVAVGPHGRPERIEGMPLNPAHHASYPYVIEDDGEIYCVPEVSESGCIRLYRAVDFPTAWEVVTTLVDDFPGVDSTLFRHEGRWWLFSTEGARDGSDTRLHAWYADGLEGPWTPHALNPLKTDVCSSRGAGSPFRWRDQLVRPAQNCSRTYGGSIVLNRIVRLSPVDFAEETVAHLRPDPDGPFPHGLHTVSRLGDRLLVDGKRSTFVPAAFQAHMAFRLRALLGMGRKSEARRPGLPGRRGVVARSPGRPVPAPSSTGFGSG